MFKTILAALSLLAISCGSPSEGGADAPTAPANLTLFGYTVVDCAWDDPNDGEVKTNYLDEVTGFSNIAQLCVFEPSDSIVPRVQAMNSAGIKPLLSIQGVFFVENGLTPDSVANYDLRPDFVDRWNQFVSSNRSILDPAFVQSFYIADEPFWSGITFDELSQVATTVKSAYPAIPVSIIEAFLALDRLRIPTTVDWVGFDRYGVVDPSTDPVYLSEFELLKSKLSTPDQKIVIVMEAEWLEAYDGLEMTLMSSVAENYYSLARSDPRVIGIFGYLWPGGLDGVGHLGLRSLPASVIDTHRRIGREIIE